MNKTFVLGIVLLSFASASGALASDAYLCASADERADHKDVEIRAMAGGAKSIRVIWSSRYAGSYKRVGAPVTRGGRTFNRYAGKYVNELGWDETSTIYVAADFSQVSRNLPGGEIPRVFVAYDCRAID